MGGRTAASRHAVSEPSIRVTNGVTTAYRFTASTATCAMPGEHPDPACMLPPAARAGSDRPTRRRGRGPRGEAVEDVAVEHPPVPARGAGGLGWRARGRFGSGASHLRRRCRCEGEDQQNADPERRDRDADERQPEQDAAEPTAGVQPGHDAQGNASTATEQPRTLRALSGRRRPRRPRTRPPCPEPLRAAHTALAEEHRTPGVSLELALQRYEGAEPLADGRRECIANTANAA